MLRNLLNDHDQVPSLASTQSPSASTPGPSQTPINNSPSKSTVLPSNNNNNNRIRSSMSPAKRPLPTSTPPRSSSQTTPRATQLASGSRMATPITSPMAQLTSSAPPRDGIASSLLTDPPTTQIDMSQITTGGSEDVEMDEEGDETEEFEDAEEGEAEGAGEGEGEDDEEEEDDDEEDEEDDEDSDEARSEDLEGGDDREDFEITDVKIATGDKVAITTVKTEPNEAADASAAPTEPKEGEEVNKLVPKKKKVRRRSPSSDLPVAPPPMRTIRLERSLLSGHDGHTLEWNILNDARAQGMVVEWAAVDDGPVDTPIEGQEGTDGPAEAGPSASGLASLIDGDAEEIARQLEARWGDAKPKKRKIVNKALDYDFDDPFIDDSELTIDAPTHYGRAKKEGFYVHQGVLELMEEEFQPKRPRPSRPRNPNAANAAPPKPSREPLSVVTARRLARAEGRGRPSHGGGTATSPIEFGDEEDANTAGPSTQSDAERSPSPPPQDYTVNRSLYKGASKEAQYLPPFSEFPRPVRHALLRLRAESLKFTWNPADKAKFPDSLKSILRSSIRATFSSDMFGTRDDAKSLFLALPSCLPYNLYTLEKLSSKLGSEDYWSFLEKCEDTGIQIFASLVQEQLPLAREQFAEAEAKYESDMKVWRDNNPHLALDTPTDIQPEEGEGDKPADSQNGKPKEPIKKFPWTSDMKEVYGQLLSNSSEMTNYNARVVDDLKLVPIKDPKDTSDKAARNALYKRVLGLFPPDYMTIGVLSAEMSKWRAKDKRRNQAEARDDRDRDE